MQPAPPGGVDNYQKCSAHRNMSLSLSGMAGSVAGNADTVAHALLRAAPELMPGLGPHGLSVLHHGVETSRLDTARTSVCATETGSVRSAGSDRDRLHEPDDFLLDGILHKLRFVVNVQFAHQVELVRLHGLDAEIESRGDLLDGSAFRQHFENLALALGERAEARLAHAAGPLDPEVVYQTGEQPWAEIAAATVDFADGCHQLVRRAVLEDVPTGADFDTLREVILVVVHRQKDDACFRALLANLARGFETAHPEHANIHEDDGGP